MFESIIAKKGACVQLFSENRAASAKKSHAQRRRGEAGEIRDQEGKLRCEGNDVIEPVQIITMDWLADNVVGSIPDKEELTEDVWPVVELQGIKQTMTVQP